SGTADDGGIYLPESKALFAALDLPEAGALVEVFHFARAAREQCRGEWAGADGTAAADGVTGGRSRGRHTSRSGTNRLLKDLSCARRLCALSATLLSAPSKGCKGPAIDPRLGMNSGWAASIALGKFALLSWYFRVGGFLTLARAPSETPITASLSL